MPGSAPDDHEGACALSPEPLGAGEHLAVTGGACLLDDIVPGLQSLWVTVDGEYVGYIRGAAACANAGFAGGAIPAGTVLLVLR